MNGEWLPSTILRAASLLAPGDQRGEWLEGWRSELWYIPRRERTRFSMGAFRDALWLRRNNPSPVTRVGMPIESPLGCLAFLAILAAASSLAAVSVPAPRVMMPSSHLRARDLPDGSMGMLLLSGLALPAMRLAMGAGANRCPMPWPDRLRRGIFLALKIALLQPILFGGFVVLLWIGPLAPIAAQLGFGASFSLAFRWVLADQRRRCPVCLRLLTDPVRVGTPSETFLEWYGSESMCSRGHGLLHSSEMPASYSGSPRWLRLDDSWSGL